MALTAEEQQELAELEELESLEQKFGRERDTSLSGDVKAFARGAAEGVTFGFADEIYGGARALAGDDYETARDESRASLDKYREDSPVLAYAGEIGASVALPFGAVKVGGSLAAKTAARLAEKAPTTAAGRTIQAAGYGAGAGGLYGAGVSEGETIGEVAKDAGVGAGVGGAFGGVLTGGLHGLASKRAGDALTPVPFTGKSIVKSRQKEIIPFASETVTDVLGRRNQSKHLINLIENKKDKHGQVDLAGIARILTRTKDNAYEKAENFGKKIPLKFEGGRLPFKDFNIPAITKEFNLLSRSGPLKGQLETYIKTSGVSNLIQKIKNREVFSYGDVIRTEKNLTNKLSSLSKSDSIGSDELYDALAVIKARFTEEIDNLVSERYIVGSTTRNADTIVAQITRNHIEKAKKLREEADALFREYIPINEAIKRGQKRKAEGGTTFELFTPRDLLAGAEKADLTKHGTDFTQGKAPLQRVAEEGIGKFGDFPQNPQLEGTLQALGLGLGATYGIGGVGGAAFVAAPYAHLGARNLVKSRFGKRLPAVTGSVGGYTGGQTAGN